MPKKVNEEAIENYRKGVAEALGIKPEEVNPKIIEKYRKAMNKFLAGEG